MTDSTVTSLALRDSEELAEDGVESSAVGVDELHRQFVIRLFERYRGHLLAYLTDLLGRPEDAEDISQEAYARLFRVEHLDRSKGRARAYLFRIATNLAYDRFRHRRVRGQQDATDICEFASDDPTPERIVALEQGLDVVKQVITELTPRCRQVILLRTARELSYEAIAERLGVSKRTVEREMRHALERCQKRLGVSEP
jgi:RNA polymerase sigma factor (sigma-70 family)